MSKRLHALLLGLSGMAIWSGASALSLTEAVRMAVDTNPETQVARSEERARVHEIRGAEAGYYPRVDAVAGIGREHISSDEDNVSRSTTGSNVGPDSDLTRKEAGVVAEQMLFDGYATKEETNRQEARHRSAAYTAESTANDVAMRTAEAYLTVLRGNELYVLAQETKESHQNIYEQMQLRQESGVGSQADLDQITGRLALANTNVLTAQANLLDASTKFQSLVGVYPDVGNMHYPNLALSLPGTLNDAIAIAERSNPALLSALADMDAGKAQHEAAKSPFYPRVTLEAEHNFMSNANGYEGDENSTIVALRMRYNLYNGGEDSARKRQTAELMNESAEIRNDKQRKVVEVLGFSWNSLQAIKRQQPYLEQHVQAATSTREAYYKQFNIGRRTLLDLLNTENELVDAKKVLIDSKYDDLISQMQLLVTTGQLQDALSLRTPNAAVSKKGS